MTFAMDINYLGHSSFRIKTKTGTVITDPFDPQAVGLKYTGVTGDIVTISHDHDDHNAYSKVAGYKKVVNGPGEYEILGISILGYQTFHDNEKGEKRGKNTVYVYETEGLRILHLGDLGHALSEELVNELGDIDVLLIPVGGSYTIGPKEAQEIVLRLEPYFVIPMHYQADGLKAETFSDLVPVEDFLKESGLTSEKMDKFTIKKEDMMEDQNTKIVVLERK
jgi:L-ascorbate metabolism protein UlaG (beta-lactamase superfamily)